MNDDAKGEYGEWQLLEKNPATRIPMLREDNKVEHYLDK